MPEMTHSQQPPIFVPPNNLTTGLDRRTCKRCGSVGQYRSTPFAVVCSNCNAVSSISQMSIPFAHLWPGHYFYIVNHAIHQYVEWQKGRWEITDRDGTVAAMNAMTTIDGESYYAYISPATFIVPSMIAMIADRFSMN